MITRDDLLKAVEYVFKDSTIKTQDSVLYIIDNSETLSFKYDNFTTGLEGIKNIYKSGIELGVMDVNYNGRILNEEDRKSVFTKLFKEDK